MNKPKNKKIKSYFRESDKKLYKVRQKIWKEDYQIFLKEGQWDYNFKFENTIKHCEQSFLNQMLFGNLLIKNSYCDSFSINRHFISTKNDKTNTKSRFLFDVMNNPKICHSLGKQADSLCPNKREKWEHIYHCLGNFTPIPGLSFLQLRHRNYGERWDLFLAYVKDKWPAWQDRGCVDITFEEYIKYTCQQLYLEDILDDLKSKIARNPNYLIEASDGDWVENVERWNQKIMRKPLSLISFNKSIESVVEDILILIEARGRCILALLREEY